MGKTTIEWTDASWNPIVGCTEISPGCANCYAARLASTRLKNLPDYSGLADKRRGEHRWHGEVRFLPERLDEPLHWRTPRRIFVCDMGDLFHESVTDEMLDDVFQTVAATRHHTYQILTKRAARMQKYCSTNGWDKCQWRNVWLGVSVENQHFADERIPLLLETQGPAVRWISAEPLLGPVEIGKVHHCAAIDWVVCGGESGPNARPMHPNWARSLRDQCQAAGVPYFFKQFGEWAPLGQIDSNRTFVGHNLGDGQMLLRYGKKLSGRLLDGREWSEFPKVAP
jgi:protein gp37